MYMYLFKYTNARTHMYNHVYIYIHISSKHTIWLDQYRRFTTCFPFAQRKKTGLGVKERSFFQRGHQQIVGGASIFPLMKQPFLWILVGGLEPATNRDLMGFYRDLYVTIINGMMVCRDPIDTPWHTQKKKSLNEFDQWIYLLIMKLKMDLSRCPT